jgi:hypothetical protein
MPAGKQQYESTAQGILPKATMDVLEGKTFTPSTARAPRSRWFYRPKRQDVELPRGEGEPRDPRLPMSWEQSQQEALRGFKILKGLTQKK